MRLGNVPLADLAGLVLVVAEPNDVGDALLDRGPVEVGERVVDGVAAEDKQVVDLLGVDVLGQLGNRERLATGAFGRSDGQEGLANVVERAVDRVGKRVDHRWLARPDDDEALAFAGNEVLGDLRDPFVAALERADSAVSCGEAFERTAPDLLSKRHGERADAAGLAPQAMVGDAAGDRIAVLDDVETVHPVGCLDNAAAVREITGRLDAALVQIEKVAVE